MGRWKSADLPVSNLLFCCCFAALLIPPARGPLEGQPTHGGFIASINSGLVPAAPSRPSPDQTPIKPRSNPDHSAELRNETYPLEGLNPYPYGLPSGGFIASEKSEKYPSGPFTGPQNPKNTPRVFFCALQSILQLSRIWRMAGLGVGISCATAAPPCATGGV